MSELKTIKITHYRHEDELTEEDMYNTLYPLSKNIGTRVFPSVIEVIKTPQPRQMTAEWLADVIEKKIHENSVYYLDIPYSENTIKYCNEIANAILQACDVFEKEGKE